MVEHLTEVPGFIIAAPSSGSGKTTVTLGLIGALRNRGLSVAAAKVGPDYIDPKFLEAAGGGDCINLDPWAMAPAQLRARLTTHAAGHDLIIVEGVMGLFDGAEGGGGATADLAQLLDLPVVLVVDASRQAQSIAALVHGFSTYRADLNVAATITTRVGSSRHANMIATALEPLPVRHLGAIPMSSALTVRSRHLGLIQASEHQQLQGLITAASETVSQSVNLDCLLELTKPFRATKQAEPFPPLGQRIAIAQDIAFGFTYPHLLSDWRASGAEIQFFSPLADEAPPSDSSSIYLPGGYPELHAAQIARGTNFRSGMLNAAELGCTIYGECGGYMVLGETLIDEHGTSHPMLGLLSHSTSFQERRRQLGYRNLERISDVPLPKHLHAHEFHYSTVAEPGIDEPLFEAADSLGQSLGQIGGRRQNVFGSYMHMIDVGS